MGIKITELPTTAVNEADYIPVANTTDGTRKVLMEDVLNNASPDVDSALSLLSENPVQNKAVAAAVNSQAAAIANISEDVDDLKSAIDLGSITPEVKTALLACFENVAWINEDGQEYYDALHDALYNRYWEVTNNLTNCTTSNESVQTIKGAAYSATITASAGYVMTGATVSITMGGNDITATAYSNGVISIPAVTGALVITISAAAKTVSSISAVYTQSGSVYVTDDLDSLKDNLVVTATYSDSSTEVIPAADYTLSGTLEVGTNTITVSYGGKTDTFTVTATEKWSYSIDDLTKVTGTLGNSTEANCGIALTTENGTAPNRRSFIVNRGDTSIAIRSGTSTIVVSQTSDYYPVPVPIGATRFTVTVAPNTQFIQALLRQLNNGVYSAYTAEGPTGYVQTELTRTFEASTDNLYLFVTTKYDSAGSSYPVEPTGLNITFS